MEILGSMITSANWEVQKEIEKSSQETIQEL